MVGLFGGEKPRFLDGCRVLAGARERQAASNDTYNDITILIGTNMYGCRYVGLTTWGCGFGLRLTIDFLSNVALTDM
jgi:hypothetical protein